MATTISTQDIIDAKRDIDDIGKAVNEKAIVSPRYGDDFKSLPMIAADAQNTIGEWRDAINTIADEDGVPALAVSTASGENQQDINDYNGAKWRNKAGGYDLNSRVMLDNGSVVKSTVANNTVNPNIDMSGWVKENKIASLRDYGGQGSGENDTPSLENAIAENNEVLLDTDQSVIRQIRVKKNITLTGHSEIKQDTSNQHTLLTNYDTGTPEDLAGLMIKRQRFIGLKFGQMPTATADDFGALKIRNGDGAITAFNTFNGVENGLITAQSPSETGIKGKGSRDTVSLCDNVDTSRRYAFVNGQSNYTRVIGLTAHSNGNNDAEEAGGTNNGGFNMGVRLVNWSVGFTMVASSVRDKANGVSYQTGTSHTIIANSFFENSRAATLVASVSNQPIGGRHIVSDVQIKDAGTNAIRTTYLGQSRFSGLIDNPGLRGIEGSATEANNEHFRLVYTGGTGTVPPAGTVITQGDVTGVLVEVFKSDRLPAAVGSTMTSTGEILVKTVQGGFFDIGALTGIGATVTRAYGAEGRNRIDATVLNAPNNSLLLGTDSNLVDLISADCHTSDGNISGNFNIIRLVITDNPTTSNTIFSGSNNIIQIVDNRKVSSVSVLYITGSNNHVIGNTKARVQITGNSNYVDIIADRITVIGNDNDVGGDSRALDGSGTGNKFNRHKKGQNADTVTFTTNASGEFAVPHGLARAAKSFVANIIGSSELLHLTVSNVANSATTSLVKVWEANGTPATGKSVTISYLASI